MCAKRINKNKDTGRWSMEELGALPLRREVCERSCTHCLLRPARVNFFFKIFQQFSCRWYMLRIRLQHSTKKSAPEVLFSFVSFPFLSTHGAELSVWFCVICFVTGATSSGAPKKQKRNVSSHVPYSLPLLLSIHPLSFSTSGACESDSAECSLNALIMLPRWSPTVICVLHTSRTQIVALVAGSVSE